MKPIAPVRRELFGVFVRAYTGPSKGECIAAARLTKADAELAAEALADVPGVACVARVKRMRWRLVACA